MKRFARPVLIALFALAVLPGAAISDENEDIPGNPWPGGGVSSSVGGSIVDRVWSVQIPQSRVAIVRLIGEPGSELGLYLFHEGSRSVLEDLPIRSSALPGSAQRFAINLQPGTYYINVNGRNTDRQYRFNLAISLFEDLTAPTLLPILASGGSRVSSSRVQIRPRAIDGLSGVSGVRWRLVGTEAWSEWNAQVDEIAAELPNLEGAHVIEMQAQNGAGLISSTATLSVVLDLSPPLITPFGGIKDGIVKQSTPNVAVVATEPIATAGLQSSLVVLTGDGTALSGTVTYDKNSKSVTFTPKTPLQVGGTYLVDWGRMTDTAGNRAAGQTTTSFVYLLPTKVFMESAPVKQVFGAQVALRGSVDGVPVDGVLEAQWRSGASLDWTVMGTGRVTRSGNYSINVSAPLGGQVRVAFAGSRTHAPAVSRPLGINVAPLLVNATSRTKSGLVVAASGAPLQIDGFIAPGGLQVQAVFSLCSDGYVNCRVIERVNLGVESSGKVAGTWSARTGYWKMRLVAMPAPGLRGTKTPWIEVRVR